MPSDPHAMLGEFPASDPTPMAAATSDEGEQGETGSALTSLAQHLAAEHAQRTPQQTGKHRPLLLDRLPMLASDLRAAYQAVLHAIAANVALSYAAEVVARQLLRGGTGSAPHSGRSARGLLSPIARTCRCWSRQCLATRLCTGTRLCDT